jgi:hypothetical protein
MGIPATGTRRSEGETSQLMTSASPKGQGDRWRPAFGTGFSRFRRPIAAGPREGAMLPFPRKMRLIRFGLLRAARSVVRAQRGQCS